MEVSALKKRLLALFSAAALLTGCTQSSGEPVPRSYTQITQEEARGIMETNPGCIILDVRRKDEYDSGHIPGAVLLPNEDITDRMPDALPDPGQCILIYCRSGNRSKDAAQKLADLGYTQVYEFGGINTWTGEIVTEETEMKAKLQFQSFDGGGPSFELFAEDPALITYEKAVDYGGQDHEEITGAAFDVIFTLSGQKPGETRLTVEERSPITESVDHIYAVTVDDALHVTVTHLKDSYPDQETTGIRLCLNGEEIPVTWEENDAVEALRGLLPLRVELSPYGGFEQVGALGDSLPRNDTEITTEPGDIMLYSGNQIVLFYGSNTWQYTRLGRIELPADELEPLLSAENRYITLEAAP